MTVRMAARPVINSRRFDITLLPSGTAFGGAGHISEGIIDCTATVYGSIRVGGSNTALERLVGRGSLVGPVTPYLRPA